VCATYNPVPELLTSMFSNTFIYTSTSIFVISLQPAKTTAYFRTFLPRITSAQVLTNQKKNELQLNTHTM